MARVVRLHYGGSMVRTHNDNMEFVGMQEFSMLFGESPLLNCLASRVKGRLG